MGMLVDEASVEALVVLDLHKSICPECQWEPLFPWLKSLFGILSDLLVGSRRTE